MSTINYEQRDHVAWMTMNRPEVLNALSKSMFRALEHGIQIAAQDREVFSLVIKGSSKAFSAGLDIREAASFGSRKETRDFVYKYVKPFWQAFLRCDKPILSIVEGAAYGAGAEIALASDIVIASTNSVFGFTGGRVGALCCISGLLGPLTMNGRKVSEMNLTGETISAQQALYYGLVNQVTSANEQAALTSKILDQIAHVSPISNSSFKRIERSMITDQSLETSYKELLRAMTSEDFKKGAKSFLEKSIARYY
ncbi:MAG TPA: enoyl-CoA hydratase/isomerase family protein [Candidatus Bathyarchaeia archaeon]|nr:enoyl-CoA hydratase/isomerase family protein [Candidatus Bathyarchaeia archaeon]